MKKAKATRKKLMDGKAADTFKKMPILKHKPCEKYKIELSQVYDWIRQQEEIMNWLLMKAKQLGHIKYDSNLKAWHGTDLTPPTHRHDEHE